LAARNKIGIGVCLNVEQEPETQKAYDDFVYSLRSLIALEKNFQLVLFPQRISKDVGGDAQKAIEQAKASRLVMLIHGRIVTRGSDAAKTHYFNLMSVILHRAFEESLHRKFAYKLLSVMPHSKKFKADQSVEFGDITAVEVTVAAKVMISMLGILYGDFENAEQWLLQAETTGVSDAKIRKLITEQKKELYLSWIVNYSHAFWIERDKNRLEQINILWNKYKVLHGDDVAAYQAQAMAKVLLEHDIDEAERLYDFKKNKKSAIYWYAKAFFEAYRKNLELAQRYYRIAFTCKLEHDAVPVQCEMFINELLDRNPDMNWLHFALGLINYKGKKDLTSALREFLIFLELCNGPEYRKERELVGAWVDEIQKQL
jgi:hypothetical protein